MTFVHLAVGSRVRGISSAGPLASPQDIPSWANPQCENCKHARERVPGVMVPNELPVDPAKNQGRDVECSALGLYRVAADFGCVRWEPK